MENLTKIKDDDNENLPQPKDSSNRRVYKGQKKHLQFRNRMGVLGSFVEIIPGEYKVDKTNIIDAAVNTGLKAKKLG